MKSLQHPHPLITIPSEDRADGVLAIGSPYANLGFNSQSFCQAIEIIAELSAVDYHWWYAGANHASIDEISYEGIVHLDSIITRKGTFVSGHLDKGCHFKHPWGLVPDKDESSVSHAPLIAFIDILNSIRLAELKGGKKYRHIVLAFDNLLPEAVVPGWEERKDRQIYHSQETKVATWLAENFYRHGRAIWLTKTQDRLGNACSHLGSNLSPFLALLDPYVYLNKGCVRNETIHYPDSDYWTIATPDYKGNVVFRYDLYENQIFYANTAEMASFMNKKLKQ